MNPNAYKLAIKKTALLIQKSKLKIDFFNIGGGFPSEYPNMKPQPLTKYFNVISNTPGKNIIRGTPLLGTTVERVSQHISVEVLIHSY